MKGTRFWTCYLTVAILILGGVYAATANLHSIPLQLSNAEMRQLAGTYTQNAHCEFTVGCSVIQCWDSPAHIVTQDMGVQRCYSSNVWCEDTAGPENTWSCRTWVYDANCENRQGPYDTFTYACTDGD